MIIRKRFIGQSLALFYMQTLKMVIKQFSGFVCGRFRDLFGHLTVDGI